MANNIKAQIIADSINTQGDRITTFILTYPRIIHAEIMTHRMFSRNAASSRAVPFEKLIKSIEETPFIPIAWQKEHSGMQGTEYITDQTRIKLLEEEWLSARDNAILSAKRIGNGEIASDDEQEHEVIPVTKQIVNRLLEPFQYFTTIVTATNFENFFFLRCPQYTNGMVEAKRSKKDYMKAYPNEGYNTWNDIDWLRTNKGMAEIHLMDLAEKMWDIYNENQPKLLKADEWHIPFGDHIDDLELDMLLQSPLYEHHQSAKIKIATARCARVSYTVVGEEGKKPNYENDIKLHDRLAASGHWSCFEHCAKAMNPLDYDDSGNMWSGNLYGFVQYRKTFNGECK